jgi:NAD-dependent dihydropyrimidine dehydrogenase PreA subunit
MIELIFADRCNGCGACDTVCPTNVFEMGDDNVPYIARQEDCQTCFMCEAHCPTDALYVSPLRTPQAVNREDVLASGVLGNFRRAVGFDQHEPGSYCYYGDYHPRTSYGPKDSTHPDAKIYAQLAEAEKRGLIDVSKRAPIGEFKEVIV